MRGICLIRLTAIAGEVVNRVDADAEVISESLHVQKVNLAFLPKAIGENHCNSTVTFD